MQTTRKKQRFFGDRSILVMLALLSAFPPLSIDLYLPALPHVMQVIVFMCLFNDERQAKNAPWERRAFLAGRYKLDLLF